LHDAQLVRRGAEYDTRGAYALQFEKWNVMIEVKILFREVLLPLINKDLPTLYALQFENTLLGPGVVLHFLSHFVFIFSIED